MQEVLKKHLKIIGYLAASSALAYVASLLAHKPEYLYFAPVINYVIYAIEKEIKEQGIIRTMLKK